MERVMPTDPQVATGRAGSSSYERKRVRDDSQLARRGGEGSRVCILILSKNRAVRPQYPGAVFCVCLSCDHVICIDTGVTVAYFTSSVTRSHVHTPRRRARRCRRVTLAGGAGGYTPAGHSGGSLWRVTFSGSYSIA